MRDTLSESLQKVKKFRIRKTRMSAVLLVLSLVVSLDVFWILRQPGLTLAGDATCRILEHTHDDACGTKVCICALAEEAHIHDDSCYETQFVDAHEYLKLVCEETDTPHIHTSDCYETIITEPYVESVLTCENGDEDHVHDDVCYETVESAGGEESVLVCGLEYEPHKHTDDCFVPEQIEAHEEQILICELSEGVHLHEDDCYEWETVCGYEEHVHKVSCYSDETADVETPLDWQNMFADYPYTGDLRRDLVGVARTQVGYTESELNFEVDDDGTFRGYTRYGAWYGAPYSDWSAMFVSFCLHYAGADPEENPGNTGAASMAKSWSKLGKYAPADAYIPTDGDLVFFEDNTVGIVAEVYHATCYVICGDAEGAVRGETLFLTDENISGWGLTAGTFIGEELLPELEEPEPLPEEIDLPEQEEDDWDVTQGPRFTISAKEKEEPVMRLFGLERLEDTGESITPPSEVTPNEIIEYLEANGGTYIFTLLDLENFPLPKDENGHYIVTANTSYELDLNFVSPMGIHPGTYTYQLPAGLTIVKGAGRFVLDDGTYVGDWSIGADGLITIALNKEMEKRSNVVITVQMNVQFAETTEVVNFDGKITVTVSKPPAATDPTKIEKWGHQGGTREDRPANTDPTKIYWQIIIGGHAGSAIPGTLLTDQVMFNEYYGKHSYTAADMANGITIGVSDANGDWHQWKVYPGDPNLTWTETGWTYTMPEIGPCEFCKELTLGNDGWTYYINYTSTPDSLDIPGMVAYMNHISVGDQHLNSTVYFRHSEVYAEVFKTGSFHGDAESGSFQWEIQIKVPGMEEGKKAEYRWYFYDYMRVIDGSEYANWKAYITNDANRATVTATNNGVTVPVPNVHDATEDDLFAWHDGDWSPSANGIEYGRQIDLLSRCDCTDETCQAWNEGKCGHYWFDRGDKVWIENGFCSCWTVPGDTVFTFSYETKDPTVIKSLVEEYGGQGNKLRNEVVLYTQNPKSSDIYYYITDTSAAVTIPSVITKEDLTVDRAGHTAHYRITVNEAKIPMVNSGTLLIHDVMTPTLAYINGSLEITTEDADGKTTTLHEGVDFTTTYDGTGKKTDENGNPAHVLDIVILRPQPVKYILTYDALFVLPEKVVEGGFPYSNYATVYLWGQSLTDGTEERRHGNVNVSASTYQMHMQKLDSQTQEPLTGAVFGVYNEHGGLVDAKESGPNGIVHFHTYVPSGAIFEPHKLYYLQEISAPPGYRLDDTKYWFTFWNEGDETSDQFDGVVGDVNAVRIPYNLTLDPDNPVINITVTNEPLNYDLPGTGGPGVYPLMLASVMFIVTPLVYGLIQRRKQERRGVG